jgi:hypothetical protein
MVSVVVATLVPLAMQLGHEPVGPAHARANLQMVRSVDTPTISAQRPVTETALAQELVVFDESLDADEEEQSDEEGEPDAQENQESDPESAVRKTAEPQTLRSSQPGLLTRATDACKDGDKKTARSTYRALPRGDTRRKEIRKACRREGVWIL